MRGFVTYIDCEQSELVLLRERLGHWLDAHSVSPELAYHVKLVAHEAARNAIEHADPCDRVEVGVELEGDDVVVHVLDTNADPWPLPPPDANGELHGLTLIHALTRRVEAVRAGEGTALVMTLLRE